jgi:hypothetical protein
LAMIGGESPRVIRRIQADAGRDGSVREESLST